MIEDITKEAQFHSFIICQTNNKQFAQKLPYFVQSSNGQLLMGTSHIPQQHQFNYSINSIAVSLNQACIVLAEGNWVKPCMSPQQLALIRKNKILAYDSLQLANNFTYFYHIGGFLGDRFTSIKPKYIFNQDCLMFEFPQLPLMYQYMPIKQLNQLKKINIEGKEVYSFHSEYAMLSDIHFRNCFVRGKKDIGSYIKDSGGYRYWMEAELCQLISNLYPLSKL